MIYGKVNAWAVSYSIEARTLLRALAKNGIVVKAHQKVAANDVRDALFGDEYKERLAGLRLDNAEKSRLEKEATAQLVNRDQMEKEISELYTLPLSQALISLPATLDAQCNPSDPQLAREALQRWAEETKRLIRDPINKQ